MQESFFLLTVGVYSEIQHESQRWSYYQILVKALRGCHIDGGMIVLKPYIICNTSWSKLSIKRLCLSNSEVYHSHYISVIFPNAIQNYPAHSLVLYLCRMHLHTCSISKRFPPKSQSQNTFPVSSEFCLRQNRVGIFDQSKYRYHEFSFTF